MPERKAHDLQKLKDNKLRRESTRVEATGDSATSKPELLNCVESLEDQAVICVLLQGWKEVRLDRIAGGFSGSFVLLAEDPAKMRLPCVVKLDHKSVVQAES